jgi:hypothetical protein
LLPIAAAAFGLTAPGVVFPITPPAPVSLNIINRPWNRGDGLPVE